MSKLEQGMAARFTKIADNGWFPSEINSDHHHLRVVVEALNPGPGMKILDAGCARGRYLKALLPSGAAVFGIDLTEVFVRDARRNVPGVPLALGSLVNLPYADASFDAVYCIEVLEHIVEIPAAIREFARVLRPNGTLVIVSKSSIGLHPRTFIPSALWKRWHEVRGDWMYNAEFPFREGWFHPEEFREFLKTLFESAETIPLSEPGARTAPLVRLFPRLAFEAAWIARKPISE